VADEDLDEDPAEVEAAWAEEIKRRIDEYDAGLVSSIPGDEVFARARALARKLEMERVQPR
jgi:putative addiction module component (TIGR02574 family)